MLMVLRSLVATLCRDDKEGEPMCSPKQHCTFILAPHRFAELTLDYKQGEQLFVFCIKQFGRAAPAPTY